MHLQIAIACDSAIDYADRLCILGTFDTIQAHDFPVIRTQCSFVFQISWGKSEEGVHSIQIQFMDEDGKQTLDDIKNAIKVRVPAGRYFTSTNHIINVHQLKFTRPGGYQAAISVDDRHLGEVQLQVVQDEESQGE